MTLPQRLSFSAQLSNCNVAKRWQVELTILSLLQLSFNIHSSNRFSCPIKFFHLKTAIGLALGESWGVACATTEKQLQRCKKSPSSKTRMQSGKGFWICLSLHSCQTATLPHVGMLNPANSAFSNFHSTFIRPIRSVVLSSSFIWKQPLGWPWANLGALLVQPQKNTDVQCLPLPVFPGKLSYANLHKAGWFKTRM